MNQHNPPLTPDEVETGRRSFVVQFWAELARDLDEVAVSRTDLRDLVALLEALKPVVVDREALKQALVGIIPDTNEGINLRLVAADAVLAALYPKATEPACTCKVTPTLRTLDRECPVHWSPIPKATEGKS